LRNFVLWIAPLIPIPRIDEESMEHCVRVALMGFVIAGIASSLAAQLNSASSPHEKPAGCHEHNHKSPGRGPDYKCCVAGHEAAILRPACIPHDGTQSTSAALLPLSLVSRISMPPIAVATNPPRLPDGNVSLRI
jgi:hypothetical protein